MVLARASLSRFLTTLQPGRSFPHIGPLSSRTRRQPRQAGSQSHGATHRGAVLLAFRAHPSEPTDNIPNENPKQQMHTFSFAPLGDNTFAVVTKNCLVLCGSCSEGPLDR